jgi:tetratricopeptide (TPR) repeat protein
MKARPRPEDPERHARQALARAEELAASVPGPEGAAARLHVADHSLRLGEVLQQQGIDDGAGACFDRARRIAETERQTGDSDVRTAAERLLGDAWLAVGSNHQNGGRHQDAADAFRTALEWIGPLNADAPAAHREHAERAGHAHGSLAVALEESGGTDEAFGHYRLSLNIADAVHAAHQDARSLAALALAHNGIAHHYGETERLVDAAHHHEESRRLNEQLLEQRPDDEHLVYCLATDHENLCDLAWRRGDAEKALEHARRGLQLRTDLCERFGPDAVAEWLELLADSQRDVAELCQELGLDDEAIRHHRAARRIAERLRATWPEHEDYQFRVADCLLMLGDALEELGDFDGALAAFTDALAADRELVARSPSQVRWHANTAHCELRIALVQLRLGRAQEAQAAIDSGVRVLSEQSKAHPEERSLLQDLSQFHADVANAWLQASARDAAEHHLRASLKIDRKLLQQTPGDETTLAHLAITYDTLAALREEAGDLDAARKFCGLAVRAEESLVARDPESVDYQVRLVQALLNLGGVLRANGTEEDESNEQLDKADTVWRRLSRLTPDHDEVCSLGGQLDRIRGVRMRDAGDHDGAEPEFDRSIETLERLLAQGTRAANVENHLADALEARVELWLDQRTAHDPSLHPTGEAEVAVFDGWTTRLVELRRALTTTRPADVLAWRDLARVLDLRAEGLEAIGRFDQARGLREEAEELHLRYGRDG